MIIDRIREDMSVISADDRCIGFINKLLNDKLTITTVSAGYAYDHMIPLAWVSEVDKYVFLDKTSAFVSANWEHAEDVAPVTARQRGHLSGRQSADEVLQSRAA
jgi:hypothetical protein